MDARMSPSQSSRAPLDQFAAGRLRARLARLSLDRLKAEINGLENGSLVILERGEPVTATLLAAELGITHQGANNYLTALWKVGLADREKQALSAGGRTFVYTIARDEDGDDER